MNRTNNDRWVLFCLSQKRPKRKKGLWIPRGYARQNHEVQRFRNVVPEKVCQPALWDVFRKKQEEEQQQSTKAIFENKIAARRQEMEMEAFAKTKKESITNHGGTAKALDKRGNYIVEVEGNKKDGGMICLNVLNFLYIYKKTLFE